MKYASIQQQCKLLKQIKLLSGVRLDLSVLSRAGPGACGAGAAGASKPTITLLTLQEENYA